MSSTPPAPSAPPPQAWRAGVVPDEDLGLPPEQQAGRSNLLQLVQLRWLAVAGQLLTVLVVHFGLGMHLPLLALGALLASMVLFNLASWLRAQVRPPVSAHELLAGLVVDQALLTAVLALCGGVHNPFVFVYLLQVTVGAMLLRGLHIWVLVALACAAIMALSQWYLPLHWPDAPLQPLSHHYIGGLLLCFALCAALVVVFLGRIGRNLRRRDARLAALRQRAAEEDHIVRLGLLASGAAHELGTPLATMSVILGDWSHMAPFAAEPELREDLEQMQAQVQRCKAIISGILLSAGDARGDALQVTTLPDFLHGLMDDWCERRGLEPLEAELGPMPAVPIIADTGLQQMVTNLLDNALEAAPAQRPRLIAHCEGLAPDDEDALDALWFAGQEAAAERAERPGADAGAGGGGGEEGGEGDDPAALGGGARIDRADPARLRLVLRVLDRGPGFAPEILAGLGRPYHSSKGRPGGGLGLFLTMNVARKLGGELQVRPRETGGSELLITLPLASLLPQRHRAGPAASAPLPGTLRSPTSDADPAARHGP